MLFDKIQMSLELPQADLCATISELANFFESTLFLYDVHQTILPTFVSIINNVS